jgi:hypothetical protein
MKNIDVGCKLVSFLIAVTLLLGWQNPILSFQEALASTHIGWTIFLIIGGIGFLLLNICAAIGLFLIKKWGVIFAYIAIPFSTILFGTTYIPFISKSLSPIIINAVILAYLIYLQILVVKRSKR